MKAFFLACCLVWSSMVAPSPAVAATNEVAESEMIVIDHDVQDSGTLVSAFDSDIPVIHLSEFDTLQALADKLNDYHHLDALHIFSHGAPGELFLVGERLASDSLTQHSKFIAGLRRVLGVDGDLLLYACELAKGEVGNSFIEKLSAATTPNIAASANLSGAADLGGDWLLELETGFINAQSVIAKEVRYSQLLAPIPATVIIDFEGSPWDFVVSGTGQSPIDAGNFKFSLSGGPIYIDPEGGESSSPGIFPSNFVQNEVLTIESLDGNEFAFKQFYMTHDSTPADWSVEGFRDGASQGTVIISIPSSSGIVSVPGKKLDYVDRIEITGPDAFGLSLNVFDNFQFDPGTSPTTTPTVSTAVATSLGFNSGTLNGSVSSDGNATVTGRGFLYSSSDTTPERGEGGVIEVDDGNGNGTGSFSETVSGLKASTSSYFQAYAENSLGISYGGVQSFTTDSPDSDGQLTAATGVS